MIFKDSAYHTAIKEEIEKLVSIENSIILGQQCASESFYGLLKNISMEKRMELPVCEDLQIGMSIGLAINGFLPISFIQRMDFLPRAADQLVNHLNLMKQATRDRYNPKVIIITTIGQPNVGLQHNKDLTEMWQACLDFPVVKLNTVEEVREIFKHAKESDTSIMIILQQELFSEKE